MSEEYPTLTKPPITEALIDFRVKLSSEFDVEKIDSIYESIKELYPERQEHTISEVKIEVKVGGVVKPSGPKIHGYRYISSDKKQVVQTRLDGFTFSRLYPYITWSELHNEAYRLWQLYKNITSPEAITRVAVRYINKLNIPMPIEDFSDYLTAPPTVPEVLPQGVGSFLSRIVLHEPSIGANIIITQALEQATPDVAPIILDIDVFKNQPDGIAEEDAWRILEELHKIKNKVFFSSITEKLKGSYK